MSGPLLVTGASGYLGRAVLGSSEPPVIATRLTSAASPAPALEWVELDVRDTAAVEAVFARVHPAAVIHTAYRQAGPGFEETNVTGSANVAAAAASLGARLVHISTDVVFDGASERPYREEDEPNPLGPYGRSKLEAEQEVLRAHPDALVVRISLMVGGPEPGTQERTVLAAARGESEIVFFEDELRSPVLVDDLAAALVELSGRSETGLLHVAGPEPVSRYELACRIAAAHGLPPERLRRGRIADSGLERAPRCVLDSSRARALLRTPIRGVSELGPVAAGQAIPRIEE
jgi:dTDP-4-dehydrorhamnose reductase